MNQPTPVTSRAASFAGGVFVTLFFTVWLAGWTIGTISMDVLAARGVWRQTISTRYPKTTGTVVRNERIKKHGSKGGEYYEVAVRYAYQVDGRPYEGERYRFRDRRGYYSDEWAAAHPVGAPVTVFYDPAAPADAALETGVTTGDLAFPLILVIFNVVAYVGVTAYLAFLWDGAKRMVGVRPALKVRRRGRFLVPDPRGSFRRLGIVGLLITACVAFLAFAGFYAGREIGPRVLALLWLLALVVMLKYLRGRWRWGWTLRQEDVEIDPVGQVLILPHDAGQPGIRNTVPFALVDAVEVTRGKPTSDRSESQPLNVVIRWRRGTEPRSTILRTYSDAAAAERLRAWLAEKVGVSSAPASAAPMASSTVHPQGLTDT